MPEAVQDESVQEAAATTPDPVQQPDPSSAIQAVTLNEIDSCDKAIMDMVKQSENRLAQITELRQVAEKVRSLSDEDFYAIDFSNLPPEYAYLQKALDLGISIPSSGLPQDQKKDIFVKNLTDTINDLHQTSQNQVLHLKRLENTRNQKWALMSKSIEKDNDLKSRIISNMNK